MRECRPGREHVVDGMSEPALLMTRSAVAGSETMNAAPPRRCRLQAKIRISDRCSYLRRG